MSLRAYSVIFMVLLIFLQAIPAAMAQSAEGEVLSEPICFTVRSEAPHRVNGSFVTNYYTRVDGIRARHRSNFRLEPKGSTDSKLGFPTDRAEFCSYGPFYPGRRLDFVIRTLVPVFECRTRVQGVELVINSEKRADDTTRIWADCAP